MTKNTTAILEQMDKSGSLPALDTDNSEVLKRGATVGDHSNNVIVHVGDEGKVEGFEFVCGENDSAEVAGGELGFREVKVFELFTVASDGGNPDDSSSQDVGNGEIVKLGAALGDGKEDFVGTKARTFGKGDITKKAPTCLDQINQISLPN